MESSQSKPTINNRTSLVFISLVIISILDLDVLRSDPIDLRAMDFLLGFGGESAKAASVVFDVLHGVI
jgi:hypothetical protein